MNYTFKQPKRWCKDSKMPQDGFSGWFEIVITSHFSFPNTKYMCFYTILQNTKVQALAPQFLQHTIQQKKALELLYTMPPELAL